MNQIGVGTFAPTEDMITRVLNVLRSGRLSYGPQSRELEERFASIHGCAHGVLSNSGTSSLQVALQTLKELHGWEDGDEVIVPALTFVATVNVVLHCRLTPVLVDIEPDFYGMDPDLLEDAITGRTRCIVPVHLFGRPCRIGEISAIARKYELKVIEDSCESMFVSRDGQSVGAWGDIGCFSFYMAHILTAGVGGMATTNCEQYARHMRSLVNHGLELSELPNGEAYDPTFLSRKFRFSRIGHSFRITELEAAIALAQLDDYERMMERRADTVWRLWLGLKGFTQLKLPTEWDQPHMMFPIVRRKGSKWPLMQHLQTWGIETREMLPLTCQPVYAGLFDEEDYPVAKWINESGYYIGSHQDMSRADVDRIVQAHVEYFGQ